MANLKKEIGLLLQENGIRPSGSKTSNVDAARISIVLTECFLKHLSGRMEINQLLTFGAFLEVDLHRLFREEYFACDEIPHEDLSHVPVKDRGGYDPLKIHTVPEGSPSALATSIIQFLKEGIHEQQSKQHREHQADFPEGPIACVFQDQQSRFAQLGG